LRRATHRARASKGIKVVPVCLPGMDFDRIGAPLNLLQGFNLHSHRALSNIARLCNQECGLELEEEFSAEDFEKIGGFAESENSLFFGQWADLMDRLCLTGSIKLDANASWGAAKELRAIYQEHGTDLEITDGKKTDAVTSFSVTGATIVQKYGERVLVSKLPKPTLTHSIMIRYAPEMFHLHAPILDRWFAETNPKPPLLLRISLNRELFETVDEEHLQTAKLYKAGTKSLEGGWRMFRDLKFRTDPNQITLAYAGDIVNQPVRELFALLVRRGVIKPAAHGRG
jgi:hypothetical protein